MCGRARCVLDISTIQSSSKVPSKNIHDLHKYTPTENMTPGKNFPVIYQDNKTDSKVLNIMTWGLIPSFTKTSQKPDFFKMFNARIESIDEKPSFRKAVKTNRCAVMLSGYFEWKVSNDTGRKQPYYVGRSEGQPMFLAGVYDTCKHVDESGVENDLKTFSIVTADAALSFREGIQSLHDRQPVFLCSSSAVDHWLQGNSDADTSTATLLDPSAAPLDLDIYPVTPLMSHASYQLEDCAKRVASPLKSKRMTDFFSRSPNKLASPISKEIEAARSPTKSSVSTTTPSLASSSAPPRKALTSPPRDLMSKKRPAGGICQFLTSDSKESSMDSGKGVKKPRTQPNREGSGSSVCFLTEEEQIRKAIAESLKDVKQVVDLS